jgi:hypothetical protein
LAPVVGACSSADSSTGIDSWDAAGGNEGGSSSSGGSGTSSSGNGSGSGSGGNSGGASGSGGTSSGGGSTGDSGTPGDGSVTVSPQSIAVPPNGSTTFSCTVSGAPNATCSWQVMESSGGSITSAGVYTAPGATGTYHVVATSSNNASSTGTATVTVVDQAVGACNALPKAGTWQNITPAQLHGDKWCTPQWNDTCPAPGQTSASGNVATYGTNAFVLDPNHAGTIYLGTSSLGLWKSTDCGSTWVHIDTGQNAAAIDAGRNWTMVLDPTDSNVLYTVAGYGPGGIYKSTNGGVDWTQILPQSLLDMSGGGFVEKITMDPTNNRHLLAGFHSDCTGTPLAGAPTGSGGWGCLVESMDAGGTWSLTTSAVTWAGTDGPGQTMIDSKTWFYSTNGPNGVWRTTTGGVSVGGKPAWTQVHMGGANGSVYRAKNGVIYSGGSRVDWSLDGISWTEISNSPNTFSVNGSVTMADDGTTLYVGSPTATYWSTPDSMNPGSFTALASALPPPVSPNAGQPLCGYLDIDSAHHLLYSSNQTDGLWRYVTQ